MGDQQFLWAVKNGDLEQVQAAVDKERKIVTQPFSSGSSPMTAAADYGQVEVMNYLLQKGADVNTADKNGLTPLCAAIYEGHTKSVHFLLEKGAKKTGQAPDGSHYIDCAEKEEIKTLLK